MEELTNTFICPAANKCEEIENGDGGCIFKRSQKLWKTQLNIGKFNYEKMQLEGIYKNNCKKLIEDKSARTILSLEIFRRQENKY